MLPPIRNSLGVAWGPDSSHVPPPTPPPAPDGLAGYHPLKILLSRFAPQLGGHGPGSATSDKHMGGMAKRANTTAVHSSVLRDFLAGF